LLKDAKIGGLSEISLMIIPFVIFCVRQFVNMLSISGAVCAVKRVGLVILVIIGMNM
jgi:hypothetical protein